MSRGAFINTKVIGTGSNKYHKYSCVENWKIRYVHIKSKTNIEPEMPNNYINK